MKNVTVEEYIEILKRLDPKAVVCRMEVEENGEPFYSSIEGTNSYSDQEYMDDIGQTVKGNIIAII